MPPTASVLVPPLPLGLSQADTAGLICALLLLGYLVYAIVRAEKF